MSTSLAAHSRILKVVRQANPREDLRRQRSFAWAVTALLFCASPLLSHWITVVAGSAKAKSKMRRFLRFLNNDLVDVAAYYRPFIQAALAAWQGQQILLAVDGTSVRDSCVLCRVSLLYRGRAVALCWKTFDSRSHSIAYRNYVSILAEVRDLLPPGCTIILLGDRGFGHRQLMKWCRKVGWHFVLRLKADSIVILPNGSRRRLDTWHPERRAVLHLDEVRLLETGGKPIDPLHVHMAFAPEPAEEVWYLASDGSGACAASALYSRRAGIECSFRDDKSGGWNWEDSPLTRSREVDRLCLIMAVATLYAVTEGTFLADSGRREELDPHDSRGLSYFQLGLRSFRHLIDQGRRLRLRLHLDPGPDPDPVSPFGIPFRLFGRFTYRPGSLPAGA